MERLPSLREMRLASQRLFKSDRPRAIDRHIDYFGGPAGHAARLADMCGEALLDCFDEEALAAAEPQAAAG